MKEFGQGALKGCERYEAGRERQALRSAAGEWRGAALAEVAVLVEAVEEAVLVEAVSVAAAAVLSRQQEDQMLLLLLSYRLQHRLPHSENDASAEVDATPAAAAAAAD